MNSDEYRDLCAVNRALIRFRGAYASWANAHGISYTEMLALYDLRDDGFCTQKRISTRYRIPPQTVNHMILNLRSRGLLHEIESAGREKVPRPALYLSYGNFGFSFVQILSKIELYEKIREL